MIAASGLLDENGLQGGAALDPPRRRTPTTGVTACAAWIRQSAQWDVCYEPSSRGGSGSGSRP